MDGGSPDTWIARLTPTGQGAIATLALHGPRAWTAARALFQPRKGELPLTPQAGRFWLGRLGDEMHDDAVLAVKRVEPACWLELHTHGGREVIRYLHDLFLAAGLRSCSGQQFLRLTSTNTLQATAAAALAEATTTRTAAILLDQYQGAFARALATIDAYLKASDVAGALGVLETLERYAGVGRHLVAPWRVVIAGPPNVGKSSLLNALAGYQRSIVAATPGTTRDLVSVRLALDGWPVEFVDTAGVREGADDLEGQGIAQARSLTARADLSLWVQDASAPSLSLPVPPGRVRTIVNKIDLIPTGDAGEADDAVRVSAKSGAGVRELCDRLAGWLVPEAPPRGVAVPFTAELCHAIALLGDHLRAGRIEDAGTLLATVGCV